MKKIKYFVDRSQFDHDYEIYEQQCHMNNKGINHMHCSCCWWKDYLKTDWRCWKRYRKNQYKDKRD